MRKPTCIKKRNLKSSNAGFSLIELLIVITIIGILAAISVVNVFSARRAANTTSAASAMRTFHQSEASYSAGAGNGSFGSPQELFAQEFIDSSLAASCLPTPTGTTVGGLVAASQRPKSGFIFVFTNPAPNRYEISGRPVVPTGLATSGDKTFFIDSSGVLRSSTSPTVNADATSAPLNN
ncbi:MAG: type II secretion system protein [Blastocatellia bacterium]